VACYKAFFAAALTKVTPCTAFRFSLAIFQRPHGLWLLDRIESEVAELRFAVMNSAGQCYNYSSEYVVFSLRGEFGGKFAR
jgi:hypothetical protein